jgi:hypothetical protein
MSLKWSAGEFQPLARTAVLRGEASLMRPTPYLRPRLYKLDCDAATDNRGGSLEAGERDIVLRIEQPVNLGAACLEQRSHARLRYFLCSHGLGELPRDDLFDRLGLRLFEDSFLFEEIVNARTHMLLAHRSNSFWRLRANARSWSGIVRVFLIKPVKRNEVLLVTT